MGRCHVVHLAGSGSSTEDTKKLVLQLFRADPHRVAQALNEQMNECTYPAQTETCLVVTCTIGFIKAAGLYVFLLPMVLFSHV